jgi:hypothetical protein
MYCAVRKPINNAADLYWNHSNIDEELWYQDARCIQCKIWGYMGRNTKLNSPPPPAPCCVIFLVSTGSGYGAVEGSFKHDNEPSGFIKGGRFLD